MTTQRYIVMRALTGEMLETDLQLTTDGATRELSGPGSLVGTVSPDVGQLTLEDGRLALEEWASSIFEEVDGEIRWGGLLQSSGFDGPEWKIEAFGYSSYPAGIPYGGDYQGAGVDPADIVREMWTHVQGYAGGNLGVTVTGATPLRLGTDSDQKVAAAARVTTAAAAALEREKTGLAALRQRLTDARQDQTAASQTRTDLNKAATAARAAHTPAKNDYSAKYRTMIARQKDLDAARKTGDAAKIAAAQAAYDTAKAAHDTAYNVVIGLETILNQRIAAVAAADLVVGEKKRTVGVRSSAVDRQAAVVDGLKDVLDNAKDTQSAAEDVARADGGSYKVQWWEAPDCGREIDALAAESPFDYLERHSWEGDSIRHEIQVVYPRAGRRRTDLSFVQGINIVDVVTPTRDGDAFANEVLGLGAGEGAGSLRRTTAVRDNRLRRVAVLSARDVTKARRLDARIRGQLERSGLGLTIDSVDVIDVGDGLFGAWQLGDDILIQATLPWLGDVDSWQRIIRWQPLTQTRARLHLARSESFNYGG